MCYTISTSYEVLFLSYKCSRFFRAFFNFEAREKNVHRTFFCYNIFTILWRLKNGTCDFCGWLFLVHGATI